MIDGVLLKPLKVFSDERGSVMHMLRSDDSFFQKFGEVYFSTVNPGHIKGWKKHLKMTQYFAVPSGNVKFVIYDDREGSPTKGDIQEAVIGADNYQLLRLPPLLWYAFAALGESPSLIANCADLPHDPEEAVNIPLTDKRIPYNFHKK
ncbi:MAG: dTDP-4-dehydrorhamnose 3,5-epimerase family protein [Nitrospirae bacterium]|nr:dTDP-4-dehydrorhamnose 3,5-epimerase family protein [Nitrospirota bacterium]